MAQRTCLMPYQTLRAGNRDTTSRQLMRLNPRACGFKSCVPQQAVGPACNAQTMKSNHILFFSTTIKKNRSPTRTQEKSTNNNSNHIILIQTQTTSRKVLPNENDQKINENHLKMSRFEPVEHHLATRIDATPLECTSPPNGLIYKETMRLNHLTVASCLGLFRFERPRNR